ncbi:MAG TPA: hypothetical protein QGF66_00945 [SAR86 cluster bacterium]|jgi:uncharacterized membrane protein|nr:hypothetical protein [SAR86 cluster bacterium]|tara:strand:- start:1293 stop:1688 length:396 start_codon:yes stop_codon:yes gene_type:complete
MSATLVHILALVYGVPFILIGIEHFREPQKFVDIVPSYLPFPLFLVYLSGVMEIGGGLGIIYPDTRVITSRFMVLFLLAVYPANLHMWLNDISYNGTKLTTQGHLVRLTVQLLLIIAALGFSGDLQKIRKS